jgi:peptide/nickel transport system substrate-binding protein
MAIVREGQGTGPYRLARGGQAALLTIPISDEEEEEDTLQDQAPDILLRGEPASRAVARFAEGGADLVLGGTAGDLPIVRAAAPGGNALVFDPVAGLFGLAFSSREGLLTDPAARRALSMAVDRQAIVASLAVPGLSARETVLPSGIPELPLATGPAWAGSPMPMRREIAAREMAALSEGEPVAVRVAMPEGPGYRLVFAHLRHDWSLIGVEAERVAPGAAADLVFIDLVAPATLASWYLRHFTCDRSRVCDPAADQALEAARAAPTTEERRAQLARADQLLAAITPFVPIAAPVRWSLVSPRLTGFRPNIFARHPPSELLADGN